MQFPLVGAALLILLAAGAELAAQRLAVVTTVMPGPRLPIAEAEDLLIDLDSAAIRARVSASIDGSYPNQISPRAVASTPDGRYLVGAQMRIPVTVPITYPLTFRDTVTGASGVLTEGVSRIAVHPRRLAVYVAFWDGGLGVVDSGGLHRIGGCESGSTASAIAVSMDGSELYVACFNSLRVLDTGTGLELRRFTLVSTPRDMLAVAGHRLFTLDYAGPIVFAVMQMSVYDLATGARLANAPTPMANRGLAWAVPSSDGTQVVVGVGSSVSSYDATPHVVDSATATVVDVWPVDRVTKLAFTSAADQAVIVRELPQGPANDYLLAVALVDVASGQVLAEGNVGWASYPGTANVVVMEPPSSPTLLEAVVVGAEVTLTWQVSDTSRLATDFVVEAGSSPTSFELLSQRLGSDGTTFVATDVPAGRYYVRVRGVNATGIGPPSNVVEVLVP